MQRWLGFLLILLAPASAHAGDYADREIIGFSSDGAYFAFEEYGIEDGSGFPYSNIYFIDTRNDAWVEGTPVRVRVEGDSPPLFETRSEAQDKARPFYAKLGISPSGRLVASNPATETSADPHRVSFLPRLIVPPSGPGLTLRLAEKELPAPHCPDFESSYKGFELFLESENETKTLHADDTLPQSRRCPVGYGISDVVTFEPEGGQTVLAVLVNVHSLGFEGPDRRFIAITTRLEE